MMGQFKGEELQEQFELVCKRIRRSAEIIVWDTKWVEDNITIDNEYLACLMQADELLHKARKLI